MSMHRILKKSPVYHDAYAVHVIDCESGRLISSSRVNLSPSTHSSELCVTLKRTPVIRVPFALPRGVQER